MIRLSGFAELMELPRIKFYFSYMTRETAEYKNSDFASQWNT